MYYMSTQRQFPRAARQGVPGLTENVHRTNLNEKRIKVRYTGIDIFLFLDSSAVLAANSTQNFH